MKNVCAGLVAAVCSALSHCARGDSNCESLVWQATSEQHGYTIVLEPLDGSIPLAEIHSWRIHIVDGETPVHPLALLVDGGMPEHSHGLPTRPTVSSYLGNGAYLIEGMAFSMFGTWDLAFLIRSPTVEDRVAFRIEFRPCSAD